MERMAVVQNSPAAHQAARAWTTGVPAQLGRRLLTLRMVAARSATLKRTSTSITMLCLPWSRSPENQLRSQRIHGDRDRFFPVEIPVSIYRSIPDAALWIIPGGDHVPIYDSTVPFTSTALRFLDGPDSK